MTTFTPWVKHVIAAPSFEGEQSCVLCGRPVLSLSGQPLSEGALYEHAGRLFSGRPLGTVVSCRDLNHGGSS